jgi:diguanylate cyclase (GGDEF)-like protein/PAS domain S-box-containing protein
LTRIGSLSRLTLDKQANADERATGIFAQQPELWNEDIVDSFYIALAASFGVLVVLAAAVHINRVNLKLRNMVRLMRRADVWQRGHNHVLAQIAADDALEDVLMGIIVGVEHARPELMCSILLVDRKTNRLKVAAAPHLPSFYNDAVNGLPADQPIGSCGTAVVTGMRVIVRDIQQEPSWVGVKDLAAKAGLVSCWSEPIINRRGEVLGTFAIYQSQAAEPAMEDIKLIEDSAYLAEIAIERQFSLEALRESEERHRLLADNAQDVIWTMDIDGRFTYVSPSVEKLRGYSANEAIEQTLEQTLTPDSLAKVKSAIGRTIAAVQNKQPFPDFVAELDHYCKDGSTVCAETRTSGIYDAEGNFIGIVGVSRDITERKKSEERIRYMAQHDSLTGLPNRALFADRLQQALSYCKRHNRALAVMLLDLDKFKPVNDSYGHALGDELLKQVAVRLLACVRTSDTVARIGGDEFVILLHQVDDIDQAKIVSEKIQLVLSEFFVIEDNSIRIGCSIGTAFYPQDGADLLSLTKVADQRMYQQKREHPAIVYT